MKDSLLYARDLRVGFPGAKVPLDIVRGVDLDLHRGEILGVVGESGSGKTMTMRSLLRILPPGARLSASELTFDGRNLLAEKGRGGGEGGISMIFQDPMTSLDPLCRVGTHIEEVLLRNRRSLTRREAKSEAVELLSRVGIPSPAERALSFPHELSGGQRQRVLIAMSLAAKPALLIADEPTTALDVTIQAQILALIRAIRGEENMAVVLITHDMGVVASLCDRVAVMYAGLILEEGPVDSLFAAPSHPYTAALLQAIPSLEEKRRERLATIAGSPPSPRAWPPGCPFEPRCPKAAPPCRAALPPLKGSRCFFPQHSASEAAHEQ